MTTLPLFDRPWPRKNIPTMNKYLIIPLLILTSLTACIEEFNAELPDSETRLLVVEGSIVGNQTCPFYLSHTFSLSDSTKYISDNYISNANICVKGSDGTTFAGKFVEPGCYEVAVGDLKLDVSYSLEIDVDGEHYSSAARQPLITPAIDSLSYAQPREDLQVDIMVTLTKDSRIDNSQTQYYSWSYDEWWEIITPFHTVWQYKPVTNEIVYSDPKTHRGFHHEPGTSRVIGSNVDYKEGHISGFRLYSRNNCGNQFEYLYYTRVTQKSISVEEYEYEKLKNLQSEEMGGLFTPQPSELPTNITCTTNSSLKAIGFVGVCANVSKSHIYIFGSQVGYRSPYVFKTWKLEDLGYDNYYDAWRFDYRVLDSNPLGTTWCKRFAVDCTASPWYCTLTVPDFWMKDEDE